MIGVVVPAHNEALLLPACLAALRRSAAHPLLLNEEVRTVVVADDCSDTTQVITSNFGVEVIALKARNVGIARGAGADLLLSLGCRWLAFTDADSRVAEDWLVQQLALDADAVCGTVQVDDWSAHGENATLIAWHFSETNFDVEGHRHIHGANLGISAPAYRDVGGFGALACSEDVALVTNLEEAGWRIAWSAKPRVITSARTSGRASGGFADALTHAVATRLQEQVVLAGPAQLSPEV